jgi:uncharacterized damage-inducible protein DinB
VNDRPEKTGAGLGSAAARIFLANERMNQVVIEGLASEAWLAKPARKGRTICAMFTHIHNVRCKWVRLTAPHLKVPRKLDRAKCSVKQARAGLAESAESCAKMLAEALGGDGGRIKKFNRDGWARPWDAGPEMLCYMIAHEAHHRGQVCMLARELGYKLPNAVNYGIWNWEKLLVDGRGEVKGKNAGTKARPLQRQSPHH